MAIDAPIPATPPPVPSVAPSAQGTAVIAPSPADRWAALRQVGWWKPIDYLMVAWLVGHILAGIFCIIFHIGSTMGLVIGMLNCVLAVGIWAVMLLYRCMDFVLQLRAVMEMLPFDAARIALGYMQGGQK